MNLHDGYDVNISVIIPVYNSKDYLEETLQSVINQNFHKYEIIVIDDGSMDCSKEIAQKLLDSSGISFKIITQENKGLSSARNTGIRASVGKYICFVDSDDIIEESHLSSMYDIAVKNYVNFVCCEFETTDIGNRKGSPSKEGKGIIIDADQFADIIIKRNPPIFVCGLLLKKEFVESNSFFFNERLRFGEDSDYLLKLLYSCDKVALTNSDTYKYLNRPGSIMKGITKEQGDIFIDEISKAYKDTILRVGNREKVDIAFNREWLGFAHAFAMNANYKNYYEISKRLNRKDIYRHIRNIGDPQLKFFSLLFHISPRFTFLIIKVYHH